MHIAFFNRSYYPDQTATGQLLTDLCEDLVKHHGYRVSVVTGRPLQPLPGTETSQGSLVARDERNGVEIVRAQGTRFDKRRFAGRATNYMTYFSTACWAGVRLDRPDVVVAMTDPPIIGLAALLAGKRAGAPLVMAFQDLFPEVAALLPDFHSTTVNGVLQRINEFLVQRSAANVAIGETMKRRLVENKGAPADRTVVIPNWADTSAIVPGSKTNAFSVAHGFADKFVVMHSGNLGLSQSLETLVEAAARLQHIPDLMWVFQGDGVKKTELLAQVAALGLSNVRFLPFAPKDALSDSFAAADVFVVSLQAGLAGYIVPSKLYGILSAGRAYVAAVEEHCEVAAITVAGQCGLVAAPGNAVALAQRIETFYRDRELTRRCGQNARQLALAGDRRVQVSRYAELFRLVKRSPATSVAVSAPDADVAHAGEGR